MYESGENYLETILMLHQKQGYVRSIDIANELGFTKPSVSRAMSILKNDGYIVVESSGNIVLTEKGNKKANQISLQNPVGFHAVLYKVNSTQTNGIYRQR